MASASHPGNNDDRGEKDNQHTSVREAARVNKVRSASRTVEGQAMPMLLLFYLQDDDAWFL